VNNAGLPHFGMVSNASEEDFDRVFGVNAKGTFLVIRAALPRMADGGRIINISSGASRRPGTTFGLYAMSKSVIDTMTIALAAELGPRGITVNAVAPGWTATEGNLAARQDEATVRRVERETALGRLGRPEDIAATVAFLASEDGQWVTGQYLEVSGGFRLV
jgi:3-oxoacyl-[acyl-carrier protein] reductase